MGVRSTYTIHIDKKTDAITTAWIGPDQGTENTTWGPAKTENATMMNGAGNWGWPFCQGGNRWDYRAKLPSRHRRRRGAPPDDARPARSAAAPTARPARSSTAAAPVANDSPYNTGLKTIPAPKPVNLWYGPQGGCYGYPKQRQRRRPSTPRQQHGTTGRRTASSVRARGSARRQPGPDRRRHLPQAGGRQARRLAVLLGRPLVPDRTSRARTTSATRC